jgi:transposase
LTRAVSAAGALEKRWRERLRQIIKEMQRHRFGRQAKTLPIVQLELELELEDVQQVEAAQAA